MSLRKGWNNLMIRHVEIKCITQEQAKEAVIRWVDSDPERIIIHTTKGYLVYSLYTYTDSEGYDYSYYTGVEALFVSPSHPYKTDNSYLYLEPSEALNMNLISQEEYEEMMSYEDERVKAQTKEQLERNIKTYTERLESYKKEWEELNNE